jgi:DNA-binding CsgD family transcriptional regulator
MSKRRSHRGPTVPLPAVEVILGLSLEVARARHARLTEREAEVARWMARGMPNAQIVAELGISPKTLDIHRARVHEKLEAPTTAAIANVINLLRLADGAVPASDVGQADGADGG